MEKAIPPTNRTPDVRLLAVLLSVVFTALTVRLTYIRLAQPTESPDSYEYRTLAENIRAHHSFSLDTHPPFGPSIRRVPVYPLFLALVAGSANVISGTRVHLWQSILDSLVAGLICLILDGGVRRRWAAAAGMIYALHPAALEYVNSTLSESLFTFLFTAAVTALIFGIRRNRLSWAAVAGVLMALAALCRPIAAPHLVAVVAVIWLSRKSIHRPFWIAAVFSVGTILTMIPWVVRSSAAAGHFALVANTSVNFALATAPEPWNLNDQYSIWRNEHYWRADPCGRALTHARTPPEDVRADHICLQVAIANLKRDPRHYVRNRIRQLVHFPLSSFDIITGNTTSFRTALQRRAYGVLGMKFGLWSFFSLIPLLAGLLGMLVGRPSIENRLCNALWVFTILIHLPGYVEYRYFFPAIPMLLVSAAYGFDWLEGTWQGSDAARASAEPMARPRDLMHE